MFKTVLITGAGSGFGRDTAETLARAGHHVFATMRDPQTRNRDHARSLQAQGIEVVELDVASDASVEQAVTEVLRKAERIDVLINNAGVASAGITETFTPDQAKVIFNTNVVGSILGRVTFPFFGIYGASKFAVEALTDSLRYEVSQLGVDVTLVQPSAYPTAMYSNIQQPADPDRAGGYGEVGEIPGALFKHFLTLFQSKSAPNPHEVAEAITKLIAQPKGTRPERTIVGSAFGSDIVNAQTAPVQAHVVEALGIAHLAKLA